MLVRHRAALLGGHGCSAKLPMSGAARLGWRWGAAARPLARASRLAARMHTQLTLLHAKA